MFVLEFKTRRKWETLINNNDQRENGSWRRDWHFMASSITISSCMFKKSLGVWQMRKTKTNPRKILAKLSSKDLLFSFTVWTCFKVDKRRLLVDADVAAKVRTAEAILFLTSFEWLTWRRGYLWSVGKICDKFSKWFCKLGLGIRIESTSCCFDFHIVVIISLYSCSVLSLWLHRPK